MEPIATLVYCRAALEYQWLNARLQISPTLAVPNIKISEIYILSFCDLNYPCTNWQQVPREGTNHMQPHQAILLHSQRGPGHWRNSPPLQHQVASNLHLKDVHEFSEGFFTHHLPTSWIGTVWIQWESKVCLEMNVNAYFIIYYIKNILYIIYIYVCNFCLLRESIQPKSSKSFFSPKLPKWLQLVTQAAAPWTFEGWQNFPNLWQVLEDVHSTTLSHRRVFN